jgi:hypothetical protein
MLMLDVLALPRGKMKNRDAAKNEGKINGGDS